MCPSDLTNAEEKLLEAVKKGDLIDYCQENEPSIFELEWNESRTIRAEVIIEIFLCQNSGWFVHHKGVRINGARITGCLDLEDMVLKFPLVLKNCWFENEIILTGAEAVQINFCGSRVPCLLAERLNLKGTLFINDGFTCEGFVDLRDSYIGKSLNAEGAVLNAILNNEKKPVLKGARMVVHGGAYFGRKFMSTGEVNLIDARIGGTLSFNYAMLDNSSGYSLNASRAVIKGNLFLSEQFQSNGEICLELCQIGGSLECEGAKLTNPEKTVLDASAINIAGGVRFVNGFFAKGSIKFPFAKIGATFECYEATFENPEGKILDAQEITTPSTVSFGPYFKGLGSIKLVGANIGGALICYESQFTHKKGKAFDATRANIKHDVIFKNSLVEGSLIIYGAEVGGSVDFSNGTCDGLTELTGARVGGELNCSGTVFKNGNKENYGWETKSDKDNFVFIARGIVVKSTFHWCKMQTKPEGIVDLLNGKVGQLSDDIKSWPSKGQLVIENFTYSSFHDSVIDIKERIEWLQKQRSYSPQPYDQVAKVFRLIGDQKHAKMIARAKQNDLRKHGGVSIGEKYLNWFLDFTIGHGYQVFRILIMGGITIILGTIIFKFARESDKIIAIKPKECHPGFNSFIYSLDVFLPIIDLQQQTYWLPVHGGSFYMTYFWIHILLGWLISTLAVVGLTGIIKKD